MSEANPNGNPNPANGGTGENPNQNQTPEAVKNADAVLAKNKELLASLASEKAARKDLEDRLQALEDERLKASGNKDKLLEDREAKLKAAELARKTDVERYARSVVTNQLTAEAALMGCEKPELVLKLVDQGAIQVDENFNVDKRQLQDALAAVKEAVPELFKRKVKRMDDLNPDPSNRVNLKSDLSKMSKEELRAQYLKVGARKN